MEIISEWYELNIIPNEKAINILDEHERYRFIQSFLNSNLEYEDEILFKLLNILESDSDLASSGFLHLLEKTHLSKDQFQIVSQRFIALGKWAELKLSNILLKKDIIANTLSGKEIEELILSQDAKLHHVILENSTENLENLRLLFELSQFKKIRIRSKHLIDMLLRSRRE